MWISALTNRNFIIADTISSQRKITIISPQPVSISEAYRAFISALHMNGLTVVPFGSFLKIVEAQGASRQPLEPTDDLSDVANDDRMVTHIHQLQHVAISTVQPVLDALKTENAEIVAYEPTNSIIITETGINLRRLLRLLERLDVPSGQERIHLYQVVHADAEELKSLLLEIFQTNEQQQQQQQAARPAATTRRASAARSRSAQAQAPAAEQPSSVGEGSQSVTVSQIIADKRTNQLIIIANERSYQRIIEIASKLDVPIPGEGQIHVISLENASATELASTLQSLAQGVESQREQRTSGSSSRASAAAASSSSSSGGTTLSGDISITADEPTNSLVVVASLRDFIALRSVVDQLDRRRQQVYVEAVIMEVSINRQNQFGLALNGGALPSIGGEQSPVFGAVSVGPLSSLTLDPSSLTGLAVGLRGPTVPGTERLIPGGLPSFGAILQAMQTDNDVNVLSAPHMLTMDNEEAEIVVGENIPFISGIQGGFGSGIGGLSSLGLGGLDIGGMDLSALGGLSSLGGYGYGGMPAVSVQRQDVALTLRIRPQISDSSFVRLEVEQQVDDVQSIDPILGPRTTTRQARTTVVVGDQETVVIGGLMRDSQFTDVNKVPFLGDIPVIGHFFRHTSTRTVKTNLLLLLTPYIIRDNSDFQEIYRRKMAEREEFMNFFGRRDINYVRAIDFNRKTGPAHTMFTRVQNALDREEERSRAFDTPATEQDIEGPENGPIRVDVRDVEGDSAADDSAADDSDLETP